MTVPLKRALLVSPTDAAEDAAKTLAARGDWVDFEEADMVVALGGDGFMLQTLHMMLDVGRPLPVFGMNLGTLGFLMNEWRTNDLDERLARAKSFDVSPLRMEAETVDGRIVTFPAINEVSLLRETRQTAKLEVNVNDRVVIEELVCDGVLWQRLLVPRPIIAPPMARSCHWARRCLLSRRSAPSAPGAGAGRSCLNQRG